MGKTYAIIVAAGRGKRMNSKTSKQFLCINGKPVLYYTLQAFSRNKLIDSIILVLPEKQIQYCKSQIIEKYGILKIDKIVAGGNERQDSVFNGLKSVTDCDLVLIHDGVRPFVDDRIIEEGIKYAGLYNACTCGVVPKDTIKIKDSKGFALSTPERNSLFSVQTPQCFKYELIYKCHEKLNKEGIIVTDDTMVVERYGYNVYLYEGSYKNIKITTQEDLVIAERIIEKCF